MVRAPARYPSTMTTRISDAMRAKIDAAYPSLLAAVANGWNIGNACKDAGVTRDQVRIRMLEKPELQKEWDLAKEQSAEAFFDDVVEIIHNPPPDSGIARMKLDGLKWLAAKRNPARYSDKHTLDVNVKTVDLTRIVQDANARLAQARHRTLGQDVSDAVVVRHALGVASSLDSTEGN